MLRWFPVRRVTVPCWIDIQDVDLKTLFKCGSNGHGPTNERIDGVPVAYPRNGIGQLVRCRCLTVIGQCWRYSVRGGHYNGIHRLGDRL